MPEGLSVLKVRILMCLMGMMDQSSSVTHLASIMNVAKSTVSRAVDWCEKYGVLERAGERKISLTAQGLRLAEEYERRLVMSREWLASEGVVKQTAEADAIKLSMEVSDETVAVIEKTMRQRMLKQRLGNEIQFSGRTFCEALEDGTYPIAFVFYRCGCKDGCTISPSMANEGFENPGQLIVKNKSGVIVLKAKSLEHISTQGPFKISGILQTMKYQDGGRFKDAGKEGNNFYFPASVLEFLNVGSSSFLQGSAILKVTCSAGHLHMPESKTIFTMFF